jgi:antitoxin PrlF
VPHFAAYPVLTSGSCFESDGSGSSHVVIRLHQRRSRHVARPAALYPYLHPRVRSGMDSTARMTTKGQVTIPKTVRDALELREGDEVLFRVERSRAVMAKTPSLLDLAGTVAVPAGKRGTAWDEVLRQTRQARAGNRI